MVIKTILYTLMHHTNSFSPQLFLQKIHVARPRDKVISPYSAEIDFRRQNLTSTVDPRTVRDTIFIMAIDP